MGRVGEIPRRVSQNILYVHNRVRLGAISYAEVS